LTFWNIHTPSRQSSTFTKKSEAPELNRNIRRAPLPKVIAEDHERYEEALSKMVLPTTTIFCELFDEIAAIEAENVAQGINEDLDDILERLNTTRKKENNNGPNRETRTGSFLVET
jgi:hypothetical protein